MTQIPVFLTNRDISVYDAVPSQTNRADRRAMLGVQAAFQRAHEKFTHLEIGSHLGGSLQPYLLNPNCTRIYSIDARPEITPDDRMKSGSTKFPDNSTARMLDLLSKVSADGVAKIVTFDCDASEVDATAIDTPPVIAFIDGEHTDRAVRSDYNFCKRVIAKGGAIVFHDYRVLRKAISENVADLKPSEASAFRIEGDVYGIFFDPGMVESDPYLRARLARHKRMQFFYPIEWGWWKLRDLLLMPKRYISREA